MKNQTVKEQVKKETRQRLMQAGIQAFARYGYHGVKIAAIARDAGIANGTFYLHFKDKQALFSEIVKMGVTKLASGLFAAHHGQVSGLIDKAEVEVVLEFAEHNRELMRIAMDSHIQELPGNNDVFSALLEMREREIRKGIEAGNINRQINPMLASRAELGMLLSTIQWWLDNKAATNREDLINTLTYLRRSWGAPDNSDVEDIDSMLEQWDTRIK